MRPRLVGHSSGRVRGARREEVSLPCEEHRWAAELCLLRGKSDSCSPVGWGCGGQTLAPGASAPKSATPDSSAVEENPDNARAVPQPVTREESPTRWAASSSLLCLSREQKVNRKVCCCQSPGLGGRGAYSGPQDPRHSQPDVPRALSPGQPLPCAQAPTAPSAELTACSQVGPRAADRPPPLRQDVPLAPACQFLLGSEDRPLPLPSQPGCLSSAGSAPALVFIGGCCPSNFFYLSLFTSLFPFLSASSNSHSPSNPVGPPLTG